MTWCSSSVAILLKGASCCTSLYASCSGQGIFEVALHYYCQD